MVVITTTPDGQHVSFNLLDFYRKGLRLFGLMTSFLDAGGSAAVLKDLGPGFDEGALRAPAIAERYPLERGERPTRGSRVAKYPVGCCSSWAERSVSGSY
jgi:hypothetical protein